MQKWSYIANLYYIHLEASEQQCFGIVPTGNWFENKLWTFFFN